MNFLKDIKEDSILLIPSNIKSKILDYINENNLLINIKLLTFNDLKVGLTYNYNNKTIYEVMNKYNLSYSVALSNIKDTYYINEDNYDNEKLNYLLDIKNYLNENNLLIKDDLFIDLLKSKKNMYVYGFDYISKYNNYLLEEVKKYINIINIEKDYKTYEKHTVYEANYIEDEVFFVAEEISKLVSQGIPLNKIYLSGLDSEYEYSIRRIFKNFNIPFSNIESTKLYDTVIAKDFFNNLNSDYETTLNYIINKYDCNNNEYNNTIYNKLIDLINKFYWANDLTKVKDLMIEEAKTISLNQTHYENEIRTIDIINNIINDDEYVFLMNFNMGKFPSIKKDEDYINDDIKPEILETSKEYNLLMKNVLLKVINNIKNIKISYKNNSITQKYYPSYLVKDNFNKEKIDINISKYSNKQNEETFAYLIDNLIKFNETNDSLSILNNSYDIPYNTYKNTFSGLNTKIDNINYSYSNITEFYKCPFRFYASKILKINEFDTTFSTFVGSLFHEVLDTCLKTNTSVDEVYDEYIKEHKSELTLKSRDYYFLEKLKPELKEIIRLIKKQYAYSNITEEDHELEIEESSKALGLNTKIDVLIKGFVDKLLYINNNVLIIDYKTGMNDKIDIDEIKYGLNIQLPLYMFLLETKYPGLNVSGLYLQKLLDFSKKGNKTKEEARFDSLKLQGLTINDLNIIKDIDSSYEKSDIIRSLSMKDNELKGKLYTYKEKDLIKNEVSKVLEDCINNVYDANFEIKPYKLGNETGCAYCSFKDLCNKTENQYKIIIKNESKGENNE